MSSRRTDPLGRSALLGCGAAIVLLLGLLTLGAFGYSGGLIALWTLPAYRAAISEVEHSQRAQALLGESISDGWLASVQLGRSRSDLLELRVQVPVRGTLRSATVFTVLERQADGFVPTSVLLDVADEEVVDLLAGNIEDAAEAVADQLTDQLREVDAYIAHGELDEALEAASAAIELAPALPDGWVRRAEVHARMDDVDAALEDVGQALKVAPEDGGAQRATADVYRRSERWDACIDAATQRLQLAEEDGQTWTLRAQCYAGAGQHRQALAGAREGCLLGDPRGCELADRLQ